MSNKSIFFGKKEKFAIEIKQNEKSEKFNLRLWFQNNGIGDFKKSGSLDYIIKEYYRLIESRSFLYEKKFGDMSDIEIYEDVVLILFKELEPNVEENLFNRMNLYSFTFGDFQFNNFSFLLINLEKESHLKFIIYEMDGKSNPIIHSYKVDVDYFFGVYIDFIKSLAAAHLLPASLL